MVMLVEACLKAVKESREAEATANPSLPEALQSCSARMLRKIEYILQLVRF